MICASGLIWTVFGAHECARPPCSGRPVARQKAAQPSPRPGQSGHSPSHRCHWKTGFQQHRRANGASRDCERLHRRLCANRCNRRESLGRVRLVGVCVLAESDRALPNGAPVHMPGNPGAWSMLEAVPAWPAPASGRQVRATASPTIVQDLAAVPGRHAAAETVAGLADPVRGLEGAFHRGLSRAFRGPYICAAHLALRTILQERGR